MNFICIVFANAYNEKQKEVTMKTSFWDTLFIVGGIFLYAVIWALLILVGIFLLPFAALALLIVAVSEMIWWRRIKKEWELQS